MIIWRVFLTEGQAIAYAAQCYVAMVRKHAEGLTRQEMNDHWNLPTRARIPDLPDHVIVGSRFPIYGRNAATGKFETEAGHTTAWCEPRETASGHWACPAYDPADPQAVAEPEWPTNDGVL